MSKLLSVVSAVDKSRKHDSYDCSSGLSQDHSNSTSSMNRPLGSEFSCTNANKNSSTSPANSDESSPYNNIKERDYIGLTEILSVTCETSDKGGDGDLKLELDLSLWVNGGKKHEVGLPKQADSIVESQVFAGGVQNGITLATMKFHNAGSNALSGVKRCYSEAIGSNEQQRGQDGEVLTGLAPRPLQHSAAAALKKSRQDNLVKGWNKANGLPFYWNTRRSPTVHGLCKDKTDHHLSASQPAHDLKDNCFRVADEPSSTKNQAVGWPPVRASRRNSLSSHPKPSGENQGNSLYVKVNMDGIPIGRKVDLNAHESYESLIQDLENMFQQSTEYHTGSQTPVGIRKGVGGYPKPLRLLDPTADVVLTYEDKEGDYMLVGDIPWKMFVNTVKRLRIMKTSDTNGFAQSHRKNINAA